MRDNLNEEVVGGIISPVSDHYPSKKGLARSRHRIEMVRRALASGDDTTSCNSGYLRSKSKWIRVDDWEAQQAGWSRTLQVIKHHRDSIKDSTTRLRILCGADLFESFNVPDLWQDEDLEEILERHGLIVITRANSDPEKTLHQSSKSPILLKHKDRIHIVAEKVQNNISSTLIRFVFINLFQHQL